MHTYLSWGEQIVTDFSANTIESMYDQGYVFTRKGNGVLLQTRSVRINLSDFELSSENKRILRKTDSVSMQPQLVPYQQYHWNIGLMGKTFYEQKFGIGTFSANKIKQLLTDPEQKNFNTLLVYAIDQPLGYAICFQTDTMLHYSYPFYDLEKSPNNMGMGMMVRAVDWAKQQGKKYVYLGSAQRPGDTYKIQFAAMEWFDGTQWQSDQAALKAIIHQA